MEGSLDLKFGGLMVLVRVAVSCALRDVSKGRFCV